MILKLINIIFIYCQFLLVFISPYKAFGQSNDFLIDSLATPETVSLYKNLKLLDQNKFMFGHQDATAYGVGWNNQLNRSDVKSVCGDYPAVYGWDLGEIGKINNIDGINFEHLKALIIEAYNRGGINTISMHIDNPVTNGNAWDNTTAVKHILIGGGAHTKYLKTLDNIAGFLKGLQTVDGTMVPIIFRPYHEHNQDWPWWGKSSCTPEEYKQLWKMTIEYLRDHHEIHSLLYVISPQDVYNNAQYFEIYPGDKWVDIWGMDNYKLWDVSEADALGLTLDNLNKEALLRGKIVSLTEVGIENIPINSWWTDYLLRAVNFSDDSKKTAWTLVWRNESINHFFAPYPGQDSESDFNQFYSNSSTLFESDLPDMYNFVPTEFIPPGIESTNSKEIFVFKAPFNFELFTNEQASVRYSLEDENYADMPSLFNVSTGGLKHETELNFTSSGEYTIYFKARDLNGNEMDNSHVATFLVDTAKRPIYWTELDYDDSSWLSGKAPLGFGDNENFTFTEKARTIYLRKFFNLNEKLNAAGLLVRGHDGIAAYINGNEIGRVNLEENTTLDYFEYAKNDSKVSNVMIFDEEHINSLTTGENLLALEVHSVLGEEPDISIDARLFNNEIIVVDLDEEWHYYDKGDEPEIFIKDKVTHLKLIDDYLPKEVLLEQNFPNPFNPTTNIRYILPRNDHIKIAVYDITGSALEILENSYKRAGKHIIKFNANKYSSGIYFYQIRTSNNIITKSMVLIK